MAKTEPTAPARSQQSRPAVESTAERLAEQLFVAQWFPDSGTTSEALAAKCLAAAQDFAAVAQRVRNGESPADILNS